MWVRGVRALSSNRDIRMEMLETSTVIPPQIRKAARAFLHATDNDDIAEILGLEDPP